MYRADISQMQIHPNHLVPPFDNVKARQALMLMVNQQDYLRAIAGDPENWRTCYSYLGCKGWLETDAGADLLKKQDLEKAKQLLAEAGYKGEKIVVMAPSDFPTINAAALTTAAMLRKLGVNVDLQAMDWGTLTSRATHQGPAIQEPGRVAHLSYHLRLCRAQGSMGTRQHLHGLREGLVRLGLLASREQGAGGAGRSDRGHRGLQEGPDGVPHRPDGEHPVRPAGGVLLVCRLPEGSTQPHC